MMLAKIQVLSRYRVPLILGDKESPHYTIKMVHYQKMTK